MYNIFGDFKMEKFEIKRILKIIQSKKWYLIDIIVLAVTIGFLYTYYFITPEYQASTTIILVKSETDSESSRVYYSK